jgi:hypothetical protein
VETAEKTEGTMANNQPAKVETTKEDSRSAIFTALREVLRIYQDDFVVKTDKPNHCSLETRSPSLNGRRMFFAAAKVKKNYVSYYLPPLYMFPELANRLSPELRRSLHGQSCFNFTAVDQNCLTELEKLTHAGFQILKEQALL